VWFTPFNCCRDSPSPLYRQEEVSATGLPQGGALRSLPAFVPEAACPRQARSPCVHFGLRQAELAGRRRRTQPRLSVRDHAGTYREPRRVCDAGRTGSAWTAWIHHMAQADAAAPQRRVQLRPPDRSSSGAAATWSRRASAAPAAGAAAWARRYFAWKSTAAGGTSRFSYRSGEKRNSKPEPSAKQQQAAAPRSGETSCH
jgi:hypothetical protein